MRIITSPILLTKSEDYIQITIFYSLTLSLVGSRLLAGSDALAKALETTVDDQNISFIDAASSAGYLTDPAQISTVFLKKGSYSAFLELHIEQGPILEEEGMSFWFYFINSSDLFQTSYMIYTLGT